MEEDFLKNDIFSAEYRFARDLVAAVIKMRAVYMPNFNIFQLDRTFFTVAQKIKIRELFSKEWPQLDEHVKKYTDRNGRSDYSDQQFLLCVAQFMEKYKPELESEEEFLLVCSRISYAAACFLRNNEKSDVISVAVDRVFEILIYTFYSTTITDAKPLFKDIRDRRYRFAYNLVKNLVEMRGIPVPDLKLPDSDNFLFTANHKNKIEELFQEEMLILDELVKSFICKDGKFNYSDENLSQCIDKILTDYDSEQNTEEELVLVCARVAYAAAFSLRENNASSVTELAVDCIHKMVKSKINFIKWERDDDYRFSCDLVEYVLNMRSGLLSFVEMSHSDNSFFMIAHRNKIEEILTREKPNLEEIVKMFTNEDGNMDYNDFRFLQCTDQITDYYKHGYKSKKEMVFACARIAYVAACFLRVNNNSNVPILAVDRMLEVIKDIDLLPNSKEEEVFIMHTQDDHYRFAYDLVKYILKLKDVPVSDPNMSDPENFLFTATHRNNIENLFWKELTQLDKMMDKITNAKGLFDYSDSNFVRCMHQIIKNYQYDQKTNEEFVYVSAKIAYLSTCFLEHNFKSNATFLAVNRIYELIKDTSCFSNSAEQVFILKAQDDHYHFAYDLTKTVFEIKGIPIYPVDLPDPDNHLFKATDRNKIQDLLTKELAQIDEMVAKLTSIGGYLDYSDNKFLRCMDHIVQAYQSDENDEEGYMYVCARIAYTAASFLIKNRTSNATSLAVNRMYEMSKDSLHLRKRIEEAWIENENYHLAYDLVKAAFQIKNNSFKVDSPDFVYSSFTNEHRNIIGNFLSKEWPCLHQIVRRFTRKFAGMTFSDGNFLHCVQQIITDYEPELKSEDGLVIVCARIAYVASCFLRKTMNLNVADLAIDRIHQMRKSFFRFGNAKEEHSFNVDVCDEKYRFAFDLVRTVMELQNTHMPEVKLPDPDNFLFTSQHRKKIKKLFRKESSKIDELVAKVINRDGNLNYSDANFLLCMHTIFKDYKYEQITKDGFVRLCARIAYPASNFLSKNCNSNATTLAVNRIHEMVRNIVYFNKDLKEKAKDEKYRFAYDLVKAVVEMSGSPVQHVELPNPKNFLFTTQHKRKIKELFSNEECQLLYVIRRFTLKNENPHYSDKSFMECTDHIIKEYKSESYTEERFVLLCARIAYVAATFVRKRCRSNATLLAVDKIYEMVKDVFSRGTMSQSCW